MLFSGRMGGIEGGIGATFTGGVAVVLLLLSTVALGKQHAMDYITEHITNGFVYTFKAMGSVIPIAGFFFLGSEDFSGSILGIERNPPSMLLAASLETSGIDASTLAAIKMGSIWTGGGTVVAWSSLISIAGFCGVTVMELVRKKLFPNYYRINYCSLCSCVSFLIIFLKVLITNNNQNAC